MAGQITKDLGGITAYAAAVAAGYTGTKAQFETLMASYATVAQNAAASATAAANSKSDAEAYAKGTRNGTPVSSGDAAYENNSKYFAEQAEDYAESLDPDTIARIDGYYDTLGAGTAEQLTSNIYEEDNTPYNFRTSGGSIDIGDRETDMLVGGTVAWNQLVPDGNFDSNYWNVNLGTLTEANNIGQYAVTTVGSYSYSNALTRNINSVVGHKYLLGGSIKPAHSKSYMAFWVNGSGDGSNQRTAYFQPTAGVWTRCEGIVNADRSNGYMQAALDCVASNGYEVGDVDELKQFVCFDLTAMFGTTIADYIYSLEQATAGAGVAWFRKLFPKPYYSYNAGELMSVQASSHNMVGFNAWDEEWEVGGINSNTGEPLEANDRIRSKNYSPCLPNTNYYCWIGSSGVSLYAWFYDADKNFISGAGVGSRITTFPNKARYFKLSTYGGNYSTYKNDICINLSWDGERNGEYEEYVKHSYALDSDLVLRGIPKLDASNNLYYDGDTYESDGTVTRKYGIVDLGTLTWSVLSDSPYGNFTTTALNQLAKQDPTKPTYICNAYDEAAFNTASSTADKYIWLNNNKTLIVKDTSKASMTAADFKTAMSGIYIVYELATPTTETADPYTNPQIVNDFGTEEYVDYAVSQGLRDVAIPVGHETQYMANLKAKLEMSPSSPEGAGDYIVRQTNGENEYVTLASNATIQNIIARLEALEGGGE